LRQVDDKAGQRVVDSLADISPELAHQVVPGPSARFTRGLRYHRVIGS
jgi:hypothetical protein